ncbi:MAG: hypothetical protein CMK59_07860 [Proteobacteria bacterium]|nr:hypothetical protein [Pseudomonadota bacterium]
MVILDIIPHAIDDAGTTAVAFALIGFFIPLIIERSLKRALSKTARSVISIFVLLVLGIHGFVDGTALVEHHFMHEDHNHGDGDWLGLGIILHRIPLGLTIWWITQSKFGKNIAALILLGMMFITALGTFWGQIWIHLLSLKTIGFFQALMGGAILHIVVDEFQNDNNSFFGAEH